MANPPGSWIWFELITDRVDAARAFYADVLGWRIDREASGASDYLMIADDAGFAGGVLPMPADMAAHGGQPQWVGYINVPDVDAALAAIVADGGTALMPATSMPGVGRFAMLTDPQGIPFYLMTPTPPPGQPDATSTVFSPDPTVMGRVGWCELASPDLAASKAFYAKHMSYRFEEAMPMGPAGDYCFIDHGGDRLGGMMQRHDAAQPLRWLFYWRVPSIAAAADRVTRAGGTILAGPHEVPGGLHILIASDPEGVGFALVGALN